MELVSVRERVTHGERAVRPFLDIRTGTTLKEDHVTVPSLYLERLTCTCVIDPKELQLLRV